MRSDFSTTRARLAATATGVLGISAISGCQPRALPAPQVINPQPVVAPQQGLATRPLVAPEQSYGQPTTLAIGEEEGGFATPTEVFATTYAIGEEDGGGLIPVEPNGGIGSGAGPIPIGINTGPLPIGEVQGDFERIYIPPE